MGPDHYHGTVKRLRGSGGGGGCSGGVNDPSVTTGCMSSVFRFFDLHHFHLCHHHHQHFNTSHSSTPQSLPGLEAPRNSFESLDDGSPPLTIPLQAMSVRTMKQTMSVVSSELEFSEDGLSSPGSSRTPSLVARLMGLESSSPKIQLPQTKLMKNSGTHSLPESPRASMTRRYDSDVDIHHRLSLQVRKSKDDDDKEDEALWKRREMIKSLVKNSEAEGWSSGRYAKEIVKQVKESVGRSRRVGLREITNIVKGMERMEVRRDEDLLPPEVRIKAKLSSPSLSSTSFITPATMGDTMSLVNEKKTAQKVKCRKAVEDKFKFSACSSSAGNMKMERESLFIRQNQHCNKSSLMSKKTPLSTEQFKITKQVVVKSDNQNGHHHHHQQQQQQLKKQINSSEAKTQTVGGHELNSQYISKILKCMGIGNHTRINTISNWYSPTHPLNPSIFNLLEPISSSTNLIPQSNRRLIFQLTDEILTDIIYPTTGHDVLRIVHMNGDQLAKLLALKIESFPVLKCEVLEDVDALVGSDYDRVVGSLDDENRSVVMEVEREILDCLLFETTAFL